MAKAPAVLWHWRLRNAKKRGGWEVLHWAMTEADAAKWARHNGVELQKVNGSREERQDLYGDGDGQGMLPAPGKGATFFPAQSTQAIEERFKDGARTVELPQDQTPEQKAH